TNPVQRRPDHLAAALSKIGGDLISDAMINKRQESLDKKQDARTKLSNERTDARNLILDKRSDKALDLQAANRSEDMRYRDTEAGRTAQYRQDTMDAQEERYLKTDAASARDAGLKATATQTKAINAKEKALLKSYQDEHKVLVESMGGEYAQAPDPNKVARVKSLQQKIDVLRGERPPAPQPVSPELLLKAKTQGSTLEEVNASLERVGKAQVTQEQWDTISAETPAPAQSGNLLNAQTTLAPGTTENVPQAP
ncbi:MAG: hypothetical protein DRQ47_09255, partial [Gammaproteobacteria bacterium]